MDSVTDQIRENIDAVEAALYGDPDTGIHGIAEMEPTAKEQQESPPLENQQEQEEQEAPADDQQEEQEKQQAPTDADPRASWSPVERRAVEIRERNPDITLYQSIQMAEQELGVTQDNPEEQEDDTTPEPTLEEQIQAIEAKLDEEGANEGLFTKEIARLTKEHARLVARREMQLAEENKKQEQAQNEFIAARKQSVMKVQSICPESKDPSSPIGQKMAEVIRELTQENNPILYRVDAPELIFNLANYRLPEAERYEVARKATSDSAPGEQASEQAPKGNRTAQKDQARTDSTQADFPPVANVAPVSGSLRSAQPAAIPLARVPDVLRETDADTLEKALYGEETGSSNLFLRL